jgi:hypothetical protein
MPSIANATGKMMADHGKPEYSTASGNDYRQHEEMYEAFLKITKWGIVSVVIVLAFLWFFIF